MLRCATSSTSDLHRSITARDEEPSHRLHPRCCRARRFRRDVDDRSESIRLASLERRLEPRDPPDIRQVLRELREATRQRKAMGCLHSLRMAHCRHFRSAWARRQRAHEHRRFLLPGTSARRNGTSGPKSSGTTSDSAQFIGDMPHTWVGSDFIRSMLDMFAYERDNDSSLVIGAGVPETWVREEKGVGIRNLSTHYGLLSYSMRSVVRGNRSQDRRPDSACHRVSDRHSSRPVA